MALTIPEQDGGPKANSSGTRRPWYLDKRAHPKEMQVYEIRNDQALPSLQTAINETGAYRYRAMRLREARSRG